jgi:hypothetical protein
MRPLPRGRSRGIERFEGVEIEEAGTEDGGDASISAARDPVKRNDVARGRGGDVATWIASRAC